jgi:hypothetical protein
MEAQNTPPSDALALGSNVRRTYLQAPAFLTLLILLSVRRILAYLSCQNYDETYSVCQLA